MRPVRAVVVSLCLLLATFPLGVLRADSTALRIAALVVQPESLTAGDVATVQVTLASGDPPPTRLTLQASVWPVAATPAQAGSAAIAEVRSTVEGAAEQFTIAVPFNEPGRWRVVVQVSDGVRVAAAERAVFVAPRLAPPPASAEALLLWGGTWVTVLRFDPQTGSIVRFLAETGVLVQERYLLVRRSIEPRGPISRLYGGVWQVNLLLADVATGEERRVALDPVRATLQPGATTSPALALSVAGVAGQPAVAVYRAVRLGQGWSADVAIVDVERETVVTRRVLQGALLGTRLIVRLEVTDHGDLVVLERALSLDGSGEVRVSIFQAEELVPLTTRRWAFTASASSDCLANPYRDGGMLGGGERPRWFAWCTDQGGSWLGIWDLASGTLVGRVVADATATAVLPAPRQQALYLVDLARGRVTVVDAQTGLPRADLGLPRSGSSGADGASLPTADQPSAAGGIRDVTLRAALSADGARLYIVYPLVGEFGDGVRVYDAASLEPVGHLLPGWLVRGVLLGPSDTVVAIAPGQSGDRLIVLEDDDPRIVVAVPERVSERLR